MTAPRVVRWTDPRTREHVLHEPVALSWRDLTLHIPAGFRWDGASVPHWVRSIIDNDDCGVAGGLSHDFLYLYGGRPPLGAIVPYSRSVTRAEADRLFLDVMKQEGVPWRIRWPAYYAVKAFGWRFWRAHTNERRAA